jgi:hypothetical protein
MELAVAEAKALPEPRPQRVTAVLAAVFERIDGQAATPDLLRSLKSGSREWLLQQAATLVRPETIWFESCCTHCDEPYDVAVDLEAAARHEPAHDTPWVEVETSLGPRTFDVPTGCHEEALAMRSDVADTRRALVALCGRGDNAEQESSLFNEHDLNRIDAAIETASPDVADESVTVCPACGAETRARIDPLTFAFPGDESVLREVHLLATAYGWSQQTILEMPSSRRSRYAAMILAGQRGTTAVAGVRARR